MNGKYIILLVDLIAILIIWFWFQWLSGILIGHLLCYFWPSSVNVYQILGDKLDQKIKERNR